MIEDVLPTLVLAALLAVVVVIDIKTLRIPDWLNLISLTAGLAFAWLRHGDLLAAVIGAGVGYVALFTVNALYRARRGKDGLGMGDAKLLAGAGAWVGWMGLPFVVLLASATGLAFVAARRIAGRPLAAGDAIPFGPFLAAGFFVVWLVLTFA